MRLEPMGGVAMTAIHKTDLMKGTPSGIVRRVLSGEAIGRLSDETGIPVRELQEWVRVFVEAGTTALDRHVHSAWKHRQQPRQEEPQSPRFHSPAEDDVDAPRLPVAEHLHQLWITLGLGDED
jgi:hypothetical protein